MDKEVIAWGGYRALKLLHLFNAIHTYNHQKVINPFRLRALPNVEQNAGDVDRVRGPQDWREVPLRKAKKKVKRTFELQRGK